MIETKFGNIESYPRKECNQEELFYRASDIDRFRDQCYKCDKSHTLKMYEYERLKVSYRYLRIAWIGVFAAFIIMLVAFILK